MALHTKTRRRIRILLIGAAALVLLGGGGYIVRKSQMAARIAASRDLGYAALQAGEYYTALHKIGPYLQRHPTDAEALMKYATARVNVAERNGKHIGEGISLFRRLLELEPGNEAAREQLLELYLMAGYHAEILSATSGREDLPSIRARAVALARTDKLPPALKDAADYLAKKPQDLQMQIFYVAVQKRAGEADEKILERVVALQKEHPDDPRYELLLGFTYMTLGNKEEALKWTRHAAARKLEEPELVRLAVEHFDSELLDSPSEASALLERTAGLGGDVQFQRMMYERLYRSGRVEEVAKRLAFLDEQKEKADTDLLGHRAMALLDLKRYDEAAQVIAQLESKKDDFTAQAWAGVLSAWPREGEPADDKRIIEACRDGLKSKSDNPYFRLQLGDALARLGENEQAQQEWAIAARNARLWPEPLQRVLRAAATTGYSQAVSQLADRLLKLAPDDPEVLATVAVIRWRAAGPPGAAATAAAIDESLKLVDQALAAHPTAETPAGVKIMLLEAAGRVDEAKAFVEKILDKQSPNLTETGYLSLARASEAGMLGLEQACFKRAREVHGSSATIEYAEASWHIRRKEATTGIETFEKARTAVADRNRINWQLCGARLLEEAQDERAGAAWRELANNQPDNLLVQRLAMSANSTQQDRELVKLCIDRIGKVLENQGVAWRLAEAQWIVTGLSSRKDAAEREQELVKATGILNDLVRQYPESFAGRVLLAQCLAELKKTDGAIEHFKAAARLSPGHLNVQIELARLLQEQRAFDEAKPHLELAERILDSAAPPTTGPTPLADPAAPPEPVRPQVAADRPTDEAWGVLAELYRQRGDADHAIEILRKRDRGHPVAQDLDLERLLAQRGRLSDEQAKELLAAPTIPSISLVAEFYARQGRLDDAEATLLLLDNLPAAQPGEKEYVRGIYYQRRADLVKSVEHLRDATNASPKAAVAWRALIASLLLDGRGEDAVQAAVDAMAAVPESESVGFRQVTEQRELVTELAKHELVRQMLVALMGPAKEVEPVNRALQVISKGLDSKSQLAQVVTQIRPTADTAPALVPLQDLLIRLYMLDQQFDEAVRAASRLMRFVPADPLPARRYAEALAAAGRWSEVIPATEQWRDRIGAPTVETDLMMAQAYVATRNPAAAEKQLKPYVDRAAKDPLKWVPVVRIYAQALIGQQRIDDARSFLEPTLAAGWQLREVWLLLAVQRINDGDQVTAWLNHLDTILPADGIDERLALTGARLQLASRTKLPAHREAADASVAAQEKLLLGSTGVRSEQWLALAVLRERFGDPTGAEAGYRKALEIKPNDPVAQNNLAMLIIRRDGDIAEAQQLAAKAAGNRDHAARADFLDTLSQVQRKAGKYAPAESAAREAVQLRPDNLSFRIGLAECLADGGNNDEARKTLEEAERRLPPGADESLRSRCESLRQKLQSSTTQNEKIG